MTTPTPDVLTVDPVPVDAIPLLLGTGEIADMFGIQRRSVHQWQSRKVLPDPDLHISGTPIWRYSTINRWAADRGRVIVNPPAGTA